MLLITRCEDESVIINEQIEVKILEVKGGRVKLGFDYPKGNTVYRKELFLKIQEENRGALNINAESLNKLLGQKGE